MLALFVLGGLVKSILPLTICSAAELRADRHRSTAPLWTQACSERNFSKDEAHAKAGKGHSPPTPYLGILLWALRRQTAGEILRANAIHLLYLDRVALVTGDAAAAASRRARAQERYFRGGDSGNTPY